MFLAASNVILVCLFVVPSAYGVRWLDNSKRGNNSEGAPSDDDQLRIFAATFNTGNANSKAYSFQQRAELIHDLTDGHEDPGDEADLIFIGFQEFTDLGAKFGIEAKTSHLWKSLSQQKMNEVEVMINNVVTIPEHVYAAKATLLEDFRAFHSNFSDQVEKFRGEYGESSQQFHKHLADNSKLSWWTQNMTDAMTLMLDKRQAEQMRSDQQSPEKQYQNFTSAIEKLKEATKAHPEASWIHDAMRPIHLWTESALQGINRIRDRYPNIRYTDMGKKTWKMLQASVDRSKSLEEGLIQNNQRHTRLQSDMDEWLNGVKKAVNREEKAISKRLYDDLMAISKAVMTLSKDIMDLVLNGNKDKQIATSAEQATRPWEHNLENSMKSWESSTSETFDKFVRQASFQMDRRHFEVNLAIQKFRSGYGCHAVNHFDTFLYVFMNPWSDWKISSVDYVSSNCKRGDSATTNAGCSIDNNQKNECGKSVNLQVFQVQKGHKSIRVCALNTHMSYAGEASQRMKYIREAVEEAQQAGCETFVFVGDFNSRLHCDLASSSIAPYDRLDPYTNSSFKYIVDSVCLGGKCSLKGWKDSILYRDELMQMMDKDSIQCLEKRKVRVNWMQSKEVWEEVRTQNTLKDLNIFEAGVPDFLPTYKVSSLTKASKLQKEWYFCPGPKPTSREESCFMNKVQKGKHNPSWTDRILLWPSKGGTAIPKATSYLRPSLDPALDSDHAPVVSKVTITVP